MAENGYIAGSAIAYVPKKGWLLCSAWEHREDKICLNSISQPFLHFFIIIVS